MNGSFWLDPDLSDAHSDASTPNNVDIGQSTKALWALRQRLQSTRSVPTFPDKEPETILRPGLTSIPMQGFMPGTPKIAGVGHSRDSGGFLVANRHTPVRATKSARQLDSSSPPNEDQSVHLYDYKFLSTKTSLT